MPDPILKPTAKNSSQALTPEERKNLGILEKQFKQHHHEITVLGLDGLAALYHADAQGRGLSKLETEQELKGKLDKWQLGDSWDKVKNIAALTANYTATASDVALLSKLAQDLNQSGSMFIKYKISHYNGKAYIIFKGNHRTRALIKGSRYLATNTQIVNMGLGKLGAAKSVMSGMRLTIVLSVAFRAVDALMQDEPTWIYFVGSLATDEVKISIAGGAAILASSLAAGGAAVGALAMGPLFAAIVVGVTVGLVLEYVDEKTGFTRSLLKALRDSESKFQANVDRLKSEWNWYHRSPEATIDFWKRVFGAPY